ncbi:protein PIF-like [Haliotis rufescens]|uniref:protein PIF-like n=1 Tax=Haliotis rufescens TaxID=6454 RepID=UPI00201E9BC4|nr:protein PIF-like [Haliotis rufescens]
MNFFALFAFVVGVTVTTGQTTPNCARLLDVIAVVDGSDSIQVNDFDTLKNALVNLTNFLDIGTAGPMFGAVIYSSTVTATAPLSTDSALLQSQILAFVLPQDGTNTHLGIAEMTRMMQEYGRNGVPKVGIVITDGRSKDPAATIVEAAKARANGIEMLAIGVGTVIDMSELKNIASSDDQVKSISDFNEVSASVLDLVKLVCKVDGNWTEWTVTTGACSASCGGGSRTISRTRTCTDPEPSNGGADCVGSDREDYTETCNTECPVGDPCDGCRYDNGVGYMRDETDCARYYQCVRPGTTVSSHHRTCPPGLYWNQGVLVCDWPANVQCTAGSVAATASTVQITVPSACDGSIRGSSGDQAKYEKLDHGIWTEMPCPPGTTYSSTICTCISDGLILAAGCKPDLYLPFNGTVQDYSGYNVAVQNVGVTAVSGYGIFNNNIQLRILRFSNMDFGNVLVISFLFRQTQATSKAQAIVTNADCEEAGSIYITTNTSTVSFRVINDGNVTHELSVSYSNTAAMNSVKLTVNNNLMKAEVNSAYDQRTFSGNIRRSQCAIQVGHGNGYDFFRGQLDELKVYTCIPTPLLTK